MQEKQTRDKLEPKDIFVTLGAHNLTAPSETQRVTSSVSEIYVHHDWNPYITSYDADIAVLKLAIPVHFNSYIQPICIAAPKSEESLITDGIVIGFGRSEYNNFENIARLIPSPILSHKKCVKQSYEHEIFSTHRTFCGGFPNGTNVCTGDSGSGLIVKHNGVHYLRGVVSSALYDLIIGCNINAYSIFTDVLEFYSWITSGIDHKVLLQNTLEENRKLKVEITK